MTMTMTHSGGPPGTNDAVAQLTEQFHQLCGDAPEGIWRSPGRVNLIGEHTDYNDGLALPFAIDRATWVAARRRSGSRVRLWSTTVAEQASAELDRVAEWDRAQFQAWSRYPLGVLWVLSRQGVELPAVDMVISSTVPIGSGLSSSAALTVAVTVTLDELAGAGMGAKAMARVSQQAESSFAGVPCGLMDQVAVLEGRAGFGVLVDFLSMETELVPIGAEPVVIMDTRVEHANASGAYADRRAACQKAAAQLGLPSLRQADLARVDNELDGVLRKRARHVVTENARVIETAARLRDNRPIGDLLIASHVSLRDDYEVSCPELDLAVGTALSNGADGARLTGAGLGGCAISLGARAEDLELPLAKAFAGAGFKKPEVYEVTPSDGAGRIA